MKSRRENLFVDTFSLFIFVLVLAGRLLEGEIGRLQGPLIYGTKPATVLPGNAGPEAVVHRTGLAVEQAGFAHLGPIFSACLEYLEAADKGPAIWYDEAGIVPIRA